MVRQAWRSLAAIGAISPPPHSAVRSRIGISSALAERTLSGIWTSLCCQGWLWSKSCTHHLFAGRVHPEHYVAPHQADQGMQAYPDRGQDNEDRERPGHIEVEILLQDQVTEARLGADELADDGANHGEHDRDVEPDEDVRQRLVEADRGENLPA